MYIIGLFSYRTRQSWVKYFEKRGYGIAVNEYDYINKVLYVEVAIIIILAFSSYVVSKSLQAHPLSGDELFYLQAILSFTVYFAFVTFMPSYIRRNFRFEFAKASCMNIIEDKKDEVNKIYHLMLGLYSYNKFLDRNLKLQFDSSMVCSRIISSLDKNNLLYLITASSKDNDKLKPISCLSNIIKLPNQEQLLMEKRLRSNIKDLFSVLTPVIILIVQLIFPTYFRNH